MTRLLLSVCKLCESATSRDRCSNFVGTAGARCSVMNNSHVAKRTAWRRTSQSYRLRRPARGTYTWFLSCHLSICRQSSYVCVCVWSGPRPFRTASQRRQAKQAFFHARRPTCIATIQLSMDTFTCTVHIGLQHSHNIPWCTMQIRQRQYTVTCQKYRFENYISFGLVILKCSRESGIFETLPVFRLCSVEGDYVRIAHDVHEN